jgi:hypothetical protein|tara:strand:- start:66 stop:260 length:195 start_codon:yes stop_codon:yes gene_type:complete
MIIYGEITAGGYLIEISYTKPEHRKPREGSIIVQLAAMPAADLLGKPVKYDRFKKLAYLKEDTE